MANPLVGCNPHRIRRRLKFGTAPFWPKLRNSFKAFGGIGKRFKRFVEETNEELLIQPRGKASNSRR